MQQIYQNNCNLGVNKKLKRSRKTGDRRKKAVFRRQYAIGR